MPEKPRPKAEQSIEGVEAKLQEVEAKLVALLSLGGRGGPSSDEPDAPAGAPLKPKPNLRSGAIALPEPEPEESLTATARSILI